MEKFCQLFARMKENISNSNTKRLLFIIIPRKFKVRYAILVLLGFSLLASFMFYNPAYGSFDSRGQYYCNPNNIEFEKTIYKAAVEKLNYEIDSYLSLEPSATPKQLQNYIIHTHFGTAESTYNIMTKAQSCLASDGIDPASIATPVTLDSHMAYAPEFGTLARIVVLFSIIGVITITRIFFMKN